MANLLFKMGEYANLADTAKKAGTIYITKDEQSMYVDISDTQRIKIQGTVAAYSTLTDFNDNIKPPYSSETIYFIADKEALIRWNDSTKKWVQLNATAKTVEEAVKALQDAIKTNADDIDALETTTNKHNDRIGSLETKVGSDTTAGSILGRIKVNEGDIDKLEDRAKALEDAIGADGSEGTIKDRLGNLEDRLGDAEKDIEDLQELGENYGGRIGNLEVQVGSDDDDDSILGRIKVNEGDIDKLEERATAVEDRAKSLEEAVGTNTTKGSILGRITTNETDIEALEENLSTLSQNVKDTYVTKDTYDSRVGVVDEAIKDINDSIGTDTTEDTIKYRIKSLETEVGSDTTENTIKYRITANEGDIETLETNVENLWNSIGTDDTKPATGTTVRYRVKSLEDRTGNLETSIGTDTTADSVKGRIKVLETEMGSNTTKDSVKYRITELERKMTDAEGDINDLEENITNNYATKVELQNVDTTLTNKINNEIKAANAMTYKGGIDAWADLPTVDSDEKPRVGDTYVVTKAFKHGNITYQPGDLLVASGTETGTGSAAVITSDLVWSRVETGYSTELEPSLTAANNTISLKSYTDAPLGNILLKSATKNLTLTTDATNNTITFDLVWDTF